MLHLGLEADHIIERAQFIVAAQLHNGIGFDVGLVFIGQADRLHRAKTQGLATAFGHDLDWQATIEITGGFTFAKLCFVRRQQGVDKGFVLFFRHRTVEVGCALLFGFTLVVTGLHPCTVHVDAVEIDDRRDGVEKGKGLGACLCGYRLGQSA